MENMSYDFVVCGAGISGMIAAVAAARKGLKVALLNDRSVPGGNASSEIGVVIQGSSHHNLNYSIYAKETGIMDELRSKLDYAVAYCGYDVAAACDAVFLDFLYDEPNIDLYLNTVVTDVETENGKITAVLAYQMKQDIHYAFTAPVYADCTGDAVVAFKAGADVSMGAEAKEEFGEKSADDAPQTWTMGHTLYFEIEDVGHPVKFVRPKFAHDVAKMDFMKDMGNPKKMRMLHVGGRFWTLEYGGQVNTIADNEHIHLELRKLVYGLWDYIKNSGKFPNAENFVIKRVHSVAGSRESRRILGDVILTETDLDQAVRFEDSVLVGGWPMDLHAPKGIYDDLPASAFIPVTMVYDIPYRSLYSRNIDNLYMAGRNISTTHIALSSTRVIATCGAMGQAIGTAAWLCKKYDYVPRDIYGNAISELQQVLLQDDQFIIGREERGNAAVEAQFTASADSQQPYENLAEEEVMGLDYPMGLTLPLPAGKLESLEVRVANKTAQAATLVVDVLKGSRKEAYVPDRSVKTMEVAVDAGFDGWLPIDVNEAAGEDQKIYLVLRPNEALEVSGSKRMLPGALTGKFYTEKAGTYNHNTCPLDEKTGYIGQDHTFRKFNICFRNVLPEQDVFRPEHVLNGYTRPYGHMNMWLSAAAESANLTLQADAPQWVESMEIFFDNELEDDRRKIIPVATVKDYNVWITTEDGEEMIPVRDNFLRRSVVQIGKKVKQIRVELLSTYGAPRFAVYGIKLY